VPAGYKRDPRQADVAKGERMLDAAARRLADIIRAFKAFDPEKDC
jgi:creatinine amidohydrolase/Fe(II)-dependent formamide hydrolase-like protein